MLYPTYRKIRICVLDSGVDDADSAINRAIRYERINVARSKTFVSPTDDWQKDTHGHGTHVTSLLLKAAPAAEIYVGKICTSKIINDEFMPGIAKVGVPTSS
jgi:subtilisin family serine protease